MIRADFFSETVTILNQAGFALFFFLFRIVICPALWCQLVWTMWSERNSDVYQSCFSPYLLPVTIVSGTFFNGLNSFWFYKIVRKIQRKVGGQEGVKAGNELTDAEREREEAERQKMKQT
mmetsp:Transcript_31677/g.66151  ORF Transcript_31677/g.66151 Transcript_31677/m.66151 type:complete len:120 (-) Transcript_31677:106-465(-)